MVCDAAVAEDEVRRISERTRAALAAYKARGGRLGASLQSCQNLTPEARKRGAKNAGAAARAKAHEADSDIADDLRVLRAKGMALRAIAEELNARGHTTRRGKPWNAMQVRRVLAKA